MIDQILGLFVTALDNVISWFQRIFDATGAGDLYLVMMCVVLTISLLLGPLLGNMRAGLSDTVRKDSGTTYVSKDGTVYNNRRG